MADWAWRGRRHRRASAWDGTEAWNGSSSGKFCIPSEWFLICQFDIAHQFEIPLQHLSSKIFLVFSQWGEDHEMAEITRSAGTQSVMQMLNTFKSLRRRDFHPNRRVLLHHLSDLSFMTWQYRSNFLCWQALRVLVEMGFEEKECIEALRLHNNRQDQAVSSRMLLFLPRFNKPWYVSVSSVWMAP